MSRFYVGQRVRLARPARPENAGAEGRITHIGFWRDNERLPNGWAAVEGMDVIVFFDGSVCLGAFFEQHVACFQNQLEPITPPHVAGSWEVIEQLLPNIREGVAA